jgi:hypothetical protein
MSPCSSCIACPYDFAFNIILRCLQLLSDELAPESSCISQPHCGGNPVSACSSHCSSGTPVEGREHELITRSNIASLFINDLPNSIGSPSDISRKEFRVGGLADGRFVISCCLSMDFSRKRDWGGGRNVSHGINIRKHKATQYACL